MHYSFQFADVLAAWPLLLKGTWTTVQLSLMATALGLVVAIACAWGKTAGPWPLRLSIQAYIEVIRNTPFLVQLFFFFFALPAIGLRWSPYTAALTAMVVNLGAYATEIIRAGIESIPKGQIEAGQALSMKGHQIFRLIVLKPALRAIYPALTSQFILLMLSSAVVSVISADDLTSVAANLQSTTFRSFEIYIVVTAIYLGLALAFSAVFRAIQRRALAYPRPPLKRDRVDMRTFGPNDFWFIVQAAQWTVLLSLIAFFGGAVGGLAVALARTADNRLAQRLATVYTQIFQGTPLLMQLFLVFFGAPVLGVEISPWLAAGIALVLNTSAFVGEIWRGSIQAVPRGQWEAAEALGLHYASRMRKVVLPQAWKIALPSTVGYMVQVIKGTSLAAIIGFTEVTRAGQIINNATFQPLIVFSAVGAVYFALCWPLSLWAGHIERRRKRLMAR